MLATHPPSSSPPFTAFLPTHPSPLSPRSANINARRPLAFMSSSTTDQKENDGNSDNNVAAFNKREPFAKRPVKKAPSPRQEDLKERRRNMFLRKVKEGREEKRFEAMGEDIMRLDFMQRQRAWEAEQARHAPLVPSDPLDPEDDEEEKLDSLYALPSSSNAMQISTQQMPPEDEEGEVDEVAQREARELEALLEFMPVDADGDGEMEGTRAQNLWSDDDDVYDELFSELMKQDQSGAMVSASQGIGGQQDGEAMDMS